MQECIQIPELLAKIAQKKAQGLTAERVAFSFMKRRIQPLMQREHLGFEYTGAVTAPGYRLKISVTIS
jgi:hypothetical protein